MTALRTTRRVLLTLGAITFGTVLYFFCARTFAGYPQYGTEFLTDVGVGLTMLTFGVAWIMDQRRLDADE
ncbi:MAG TPA: hypothetical protein VGN51_09965 [Acidimicrobiia bacterium]